MDCCICLDETGFTVRKVKPKTCNDVLLKCGHTFHRTCIKSWFLKNDACPMCRSELRFNEGSYFKYMMLLHEFVRCFGHPTYSNSIRFQFEYDVFVYHDNASLILFVHHTKQNQLHFSHSTFQSKHRIGFKGLSRLF